MKLNLQSFDHWLKVVENKSVNEQILTFGGTIPTEDKWQTLQDQNYANVVNTAVPFGDKLFIANDVDFLKANIGKSIRFKYDNSEVYPKIIQPKLMASLPTIEENNGIMKESNTPYTRENNKAYAEYILKNYKYTTSPYYLSVKLWLETGCWEESELKFKNKKDLRPEGLQIEADGLRLNFLYDNMTWHGQVNKELLSYDDFLSQNAN